MIVSTGETVEGQERILTLSCPDVLVKLFYAIVMKLETVMPREEMLKKRCYPRDRFERKLRR